MKASEVQPVTTPAPEVQTPESKILDMASSVLTGEIFSGDETTVVEFRENFGRFLEGLKGIAKEFDSQLVNLRQANGADFLVKVEHFRKPRESTKSNNSLLDNLRL